MRWPTGSVPVGDRGWDGWCLIEIGTDKPARSVDVLEFGQLRDFRDMANFRLTLAEAKQILSRVQRAVAAAQAHDHAVLRPDCSSCGGGICHIKGWRSSAVPVSRHSLSPLDQGDGLPAPRETGSTESERTPCAPWMSTPSMSAVADGPVWKLA